ncbi:MAG: hypothetical protein ACK557_07325, partial [Planctomycetota bacterium]
LDRAAELRAAGELPLAQASDYTKDSSGARFPATGMTVADRLQTSSGMAKSRIKQHDSGKKTSLSESL